LPPSSVLPILLFSLLLQKYLLKGLTLGAVKG
jgi:ABC-type glycerol-3-phosphate transport system permease component